MATASAKYSSPASEPFTLSENVAGTDKTQQLASLRTIVSSLQHQINKELTVRMEEDKAREAGESTASPVDEVMEEENYGEEVPDDED
jgi:hypothetical protein